MFNRHAIKLCFALLCAACAERGADREPHADSSDTDDGSTTDSSGLTTIGETATEGAPDLPTSCDPYDSECPLGTKCSPELGKCLWAGTGTLGQSCSIDLSALSDTCDADHLCLDYDLFENDSTPGYCAPPCEGTEIDPQCPSGTDCFKGFCIPDSCNPLQPLCPEDWPCIAIFPSKAAHCDYRDGISYGAAQLGEPCEDDCAGGLVCVPQAEVPGCGATSCCSSYCDLDNPTACDLLPETVCQAVLDFEYGTCTLR